MNGFTQPVIVGTGGAAQVLTRIPLGQGAEGNFLEEWLQNALFRHSQCLPVREIDPHIDVFERFGGHVERSNGAIVIRTRGALQASSHWMEV